MKQNLYFGCVESRQDPLKLGRCQVRVVGLHTEDKSILPTDKLPWAIPLQATSSAAISGIGDAPLGFVEGSFVVVVFMDPDQQQPMILGGIAGIPQERGIIDVSDDSIILKNSDGDTIANNEQVASVDDETLFKPAMSYNAISDRLRSFIKAEESLRLSAYQDSGGVWTVGYGTTLINGQPVTPNLVITESQADEYLTVAILDAIDSVRKNTKALISPSMFDSLCSFVYNVGRGRYFKSDLRTELNANRYLECSARFKDYIKDSQGKTQNGLIIRRELEKVMFLSDGLPSNTGETPRQKQTPVDDVTTDGIVSSGISNTNLGFQDPKGVYPLYKNEPDTNRLARHESISKTIVFKKEAARERNVPVAGGGTWDQSPVPYNAQYPFNKVFQSESGHVMEFDDTKNSERVHIYHKTGTFTEIDANGTQVNRIVGDGYEILERNGFVHINGNANVTIDGANNVRVGGALNLDVVGKTTVNIYNDVDLNVSGSMDVAVAGAYNLKAASVKIESAGGLDISSGNTIIDTGSFGVKSGSSTIDTGSFGVKSGSSTFDTGSFGVGTGSFVTSVEIDLGGVGGVGGVGSASKTGLSTPGAIQTPEEIAFSELSVITRGAEAALQYETPEDGDPTNYTKYQVDKGLIFEEDLDSGEETKTETPNESKAKPVDTSCDVIFGMEEFPASLQLSKNFTLGALTKDGTRKLVDQFGMTKQQIACNLKHLAINCLDVIYERFPNMIITSGFRRPGDAINSSPVSDHYFGYAADIRLNGYSKEQHFEAIKVIQQLVPHNQLILEYSGKHTCWIHVSYKSSGGNKKQVFTMRDHKRVGSIGQFKLIV